MLIQTVSDWNFDVFGLNEQAEGQGLRYIGFDLMQKYNLLTKFKVIKLQKMKISIFLNTSNIILLFKTPQRICELFNLYLFQVNF